MKKFILYRKLHKKIESSHQIELIHEHVELFMKNSPISNPKKQGPLGPKYLPVSSNTDFAGCHYELYKIAGSSDGGYSYVETRES